MKYRKKPVEIEAMQFSRDNGYDIVKWIGNSTIAVFNPEYDDATSYPIPSTLEIKTLEGVMKAQTGDYIIKGVKGEFYPCKPDIFELTYEKV